MIGLYLYTLIISHKYCNMQSILNKLTLQKQLQNVVTNNVFLDKKTNKNTTTTKQKINKKTLPKTGIEPRHSGSQCKCVTSVSPTESIDCNQAI